MKKEDIMAYGKLLLAPAMLILLGLILIVNPDAASVVIARIVGYILIAGAVFTGLSAVVTKRGQVGKDIAAVVLAVVGGWLTANPLLLAAWIGRFLGLVILVNSIPDLIYAHKYGRNVLFDLLAVVVGAILVLLPMTASRLVFSLCGAAILVIGVLMLLDRLRGRRRLPKGEKPDIIDAL